MTTSDNRLVDMDCLLEEEKKEIFYKFVWHLGPIHLLLFLLFYLEWKFPTELLHMTKHLIDWNKFHFEETLEPTIWQAKQICFDPLSNLYSLSTSRGQNQKFLWRCSLPKEHFCKKKMILFFLTNFSFWIGYDENNKN